LLAHTELRGEYFLHDVKGGGFAAATTGLRALAALASSPGSSRS